MPTEEVTPVQGTTETENVTPQDGETFDAERAMSTIRKLREFEKAAKGQLKELDTLKAKLTEAETAKLTEQERLARKATDLEQQLGALAPRAELAGKLAEHITAQLSAETKDWPKEVAGTRPDTDDVLALLAWAEKMRPLARRLAEAEKAQPVRGVTSGPKPAGPAQLPRTPGRTVTL
jgi:hypothetical protein